MRWLIPACVLWLSACVTGNAVRDLAPGMSRAEALSALGAPDGMRSDPPYEILTYSNRLMSGWSWDRTDYYVILVDGRVAEYGNGEVRQNAAPGGVTYILVNPYAY